MCFAPSRKLTSRWLRPDRLRYMRKLWVSREDTVSHGHTSAATSTCCRFSVAEIRRPGRREQMPHVATYLESDRRIIAVFHGRNVALRSTRGVMKVGKVNGITVSKNALTIPHRRKMSRLAAPASRPVFQESAHTLRLFCNE